MRLLFITAEFPYPPTHGGRADTWQRLRAFVDAGTEVHLVCWCSDRRGGAPSPAETAAVRKVVCDLTVIPIELRPSDLAWRVANLWHMPSHASARFPRGARRRELLASIDAFAPEAIWLDGLWPAAFARLVAARTMQPYFYRSHNVEHRYMARQAALARSPAYRFRLAINLLGLRTFEERVVRDAAVLFDISLDDLRFWAMHGSRVGRWLPPIVRGQESGVGRPTEAAQYDIGFVGNLHTPNNVEGLRWLLREVWPRVRSARASATALVAGSAPSAEVRALVDAAKGVELLADPVDIWPVYGSARVLVNPVQNGSGLNIKAAEMLQLDGPIVSTSVGVGGLPIEMHAQFLLADDPATFAAAIDSALASRERSVDIVQRQAARRVFSPSVIADVIETMRTYRANALPAGLHA